MLFQAVFDRIVFIRSKVMHLSFHALFPSWFQFYVENTQMTTLFDVSSDKTSRQCKYCLNCLNSWVGDPSFEGSEYVLHSTFGHSTKNSDCHTLIPFNSLFNFRIDVFCSMLPSRKLVKMHNFVESKVITYLFVQLLLFLGPYYL